LAFDAEELARAILVRVIPGRRYRTAGPTDARFAGFASDTIRIGYRQQGKNPSLLLFSGPGQDPRAAARAAAEWAAANWRPNAIQRTVRPGVVVVHVAPRAQLVAAGPVEGTAVPATVWTVDSESGRTETPGRPPGSPPPGDVRGPAAALARGVHAPTLGELDHVERQVMIGRTAPMPPVLTGIGALVVVFFALRYGLLVFNSLISWARISQAGGASQLIALGFVAANALLLIGIALGAGLLLNVGNLAYRAPGFSSQSPRVRRASWAGYVLVMLALVVAVEYVLPRALGGVTPRAVPGG
jgi:hypothetical protein